MRRTVVVVGGGYGGAAVAKALEPAADVVLIDPRDAFVNAAGSLRALIQPDCGQLPTPDGPAAVPATTVSQYRGADLFTGRFTEQFGPTSA